MNIALIYHKNPYTKNPRGGELSVRAIVDYLTKKGHHIALSDGSSPYIIEGADVVLTWGNPAEDTARVCGQLKKPLCLMVRFWKNVAPLPAGNLMEREIDTNFTASKQHLFETAAAIVTNTDYSRKVIERWQPISKGKVHVSYVPILGEYDPIPEPGECVTVITPEIYSENWLVNGLAKLMPEQKFLVVNASPKYFKAQHPNIEVCGYMDQDEIWKRTRVLLVPVYGNDICGTRRVTIECMRRGLPVLASNRCGMREKLRGSLLMKERLSITGWQKRISRVMAQYHDFQEIARYTWNHYNTPPRS
jgi:glycosyltransferase involved in cell wall biosynthesis